MRKYLLLALTATIVVAFTATALAVTNLAGIQAAVSPAKTSTSKKKPRQVSATITVLSADGEGGVPDATSNVDVDFPKGMDPKYASKFKTCDAETAGTNPTKCPKNSQFGAGSADTITPTPLGNITMAAQVWAFNAKKNSDGDRQVLLVAKPDKLAQYIVLTGTLIKNDDGSWKLHVPVTVPQAVQGVDTRITRFMVKTNKSAKVRETKRYRKNGKSLKRKVTRSYKYLVAPTTCTSDGWVFTQTSTFKNGDVKTSTAKVACKK